MWVGKDFYNYQATEIKMSEVIPQNSEVSFPSSQGHHHTVTAGRHVCCKGEKIKINF